MDAVGRREAGMQRARVVPEGETPCIWMLAGVLSCWICDLQLDCERCPLDAALRHETRRVLQPPVDAVLDRAANAQPASAAPEDSSREQGVQDLEMRDLPALDPDALYSRGHLWVRFEAEGRARVGLDAFAARIVGRLRCVVLPLVGSRLQRGRPCTWLDQPGGTLTLLAPLSGLVLECNEKLARGSNFELHDSMASAWLFVLQPHRPRTEALALLHAEDFSAIVQRDLESWHQALVRTLDVVTASGGETLADGGLLVRSAIEVLGAGGMHRLAARTLRPSRAGSSTRLRRKP